MSGILVPGVPERAYLRGDPPPGATGELAGPSLSSTGARRILQSPSLYRHEADHPEPATDAMDIGSVAHKRILGVGSDVVVVDARDWRMKGARAHRDQCRADGLVAIHRGQLPGTGAMARAVGRHPLASRILDGAAKEVSGWWVDPATGVCCRLRIDALHPRAIVDVKTTTTVTPDEWVRNHVTRYGYHIQAAWYLDGHEAITGQRLPFLWIVVRSTPPHDVWVVDLADVDLDLGRERAHEARVLYAECASQNDWPEAGRYPGREPDVLHLSLPGWMHREREYAA